MYASDSLFQRLTNDGPSIYYNDAFLDMVYDHLEDMKQNRGVMVIQVDKTEAYTCQGDLSKLLLTHNVPFHLHQITARLNGLASIEQYTPDILTLSIPMENYIDRLRARYTTTNVL